MRYLLLFTALVLTSGLLSNGLVISNVQYNNGSNQITFTAQWENSFHNGNTNNPTYDGVWVFIKYAPSGGDQWLHADLASANSVSGWSAVVPSDRKGVMIWKNTEHYGNVGPQAFTVTLDPLTGSTPDFKVFGMEMVYVEEGPFYAGDGTSTNTLYMNGSVTSPLYITSEAALTRGMSMGQFGGGNGTTNISSQFPKGYDSFWSMKYKVTNEQVMDFLNCLSRPHQEANVNVDISGTNVTNYYVYSNTNYQTAEGNSIRCDQSIGIGRVEFYCDYSQNGIGNEINDGQNIVAGYLTMEQKMAFLDWTALRPMSELEYEKLCRGEAMLPVPGEFPWGNTIYTNTSTIINRGSPNESTTNIGSEGLIGTGYGIGLRAGLQSTNTSSRSQAAATFYGIMDASNLLESMIGIENQTFNRNEHGDGNLGIASGTSDPIKDKCMIFHIQLDSEE